MTQAASKVRTYEVVSGEMVETVPILDDGSGPVEVTRCVTIVSARNKNEARRKAIKTSDMRDWVKDRRYCNQCPMAHLTVTLISHELLDEGDYYEGY
jgi:hypothetical protein